MGLRSWFAKNVTGAFAYGEALGRSTGENGLALGRILYLGHGKSARTTANCVFETAESMASLGFDVYCPDSSAQPPAEDSSRLSVLTRAAGVAFASIIAMNAANCFKNRENLLSFCRAIGASNAAYVEEMSPDIAIEILKQFMRIEVPGTISEVLDLTHPGSADLFGVYLGEISKQYGSGSIGFRRSGIVGFDALVTTLSEQTVTAVRGAARQLGF